jgi:hypothetical protein
MRCMVIAQTRQYRTQVNIPKATCHPPFSQPAITHFTLIGSHGRLLTGRECQRVAIFAPLRLADLPNVHGRPPLPSAGSETSQLHELQLARREKAMAPRRSPLKRCRQSTSLRCHLITLIRSATVVRDPSSRPNSPINFRNGSGLFASPAIQV